MTSTSPAARPPGGGGDRWVLGIETATPWGGCALARLDGGLLAEKWGWARTGFSRRLLGSIDACLKSAGGGRENLAAIAVTDGPGSFTGVRLGLTVARTLSHALGLPLYSFSTLENLAARWPVPGARVAAMLDARRGETYAAVYEIGADGDPRVLQGERAESPESFLASQAPGEGCLWFTGDAVDAQWESIRARFGDLACRVPDPLNRPSAAAAALRGAARLRRGESAADLLTVLPRYLRASDADRALEKA